jgi:hypothetical protein
MRCVLRLQAAGLVALACAIFGSAGCSSMKVDTHTTDPTFAFAKIHTWAWANPGGAAESTASGAAAATDTSAATRSSSTGSSAANPIASTSPGPVADTPAGVAAVREAVDEALARKGYVKAPAGTQPDFLVASRALIAKRYAVEQSDGGAAPMYTGPNAASDSGYRISPAVSSPTAQSSSGGGHGGTSREFDQGELLLEVIDPMTNTVVWHGLAADRINTRADLEHKEGLIGKALSKMLSDFPPKAKKK